jgi:hypothetical protein
VHNIINKVPPAALVTALICFFLPFVTFSCQGQKIVSLTGIQLVTGSSIQQPQMFGPPTTQKLDPEPLAIAAFFSVIVGLGLSFMKRKKGVFGSSFLAGLGLVCLLALKSKLDNDALRQGGGAIQVQYEVGFYLLLLLLLASIGASVLAWLQAKGKPMIAFKGGGADKFCTQCGARNISSDLFCKECGAKFA